MNHHKHIVTLHRTLVVCDNQNGRVTVRKDGGTFNVRLFDRYYHKKSITPRKTLKGAIETAEIAKELCL